MPCYILPHHVQIYQDLPFVYVYADDNPVAFCTSEEHKKHFRILKDYRNMRCHENLEKSFSMNYL